MKYAGRNRAFNVAKLKTTGLVPGVFDLLFYWKNCLYCFDIKIGKDKLSENQVKFMLAVSKNGAFCCEIHTFEQFKGNIERIVI